MYPCLAYSIGFRDYGLTVEDLREYCKNYEQVVYTIAFDESDSDSDDTEPRYSKSFIDFSKNVGERAPLTLELESVFKAVCLGDIDESMLDLDMDRLMGKSFADFQVIARIGHGLAEDEFQEIVNRTVSRLKNYQLTFASCTELFQLFNNLYLLSSGGGIREPINDLETIAGQVVEQAIERDQIENSEFLCHIDDNAPEFLKVLYAKLEDLRDKITERRRLKEQRNLLIGGLSGNPGSLSDLNRMSSTPFWSDDLVDDTFEKLKHASHDVIYEFCRLINSRYKGRDLKTEIAHLQRLRDLVKNHAENLQNSLVKYHLNCLVKYLSAAESTLKDQED
jgi:hypothetical protein